MTPSSYRLLFVLPTLKLQLTQTVVAVATFKTPSINWTATAPFFHFHIMHLYYLWLQLTVILLRILLLLEQGHIALKTWYLFVNDNIDFSSSEWCEQYTFYSTFRDPKKRSGKHFCCSRAIQPFGCAVFLHSSQNCSSRTWGCAQLVELLIKCCFCS